MQAQDLLERRVIYPAGDLAGQIAASKHRADLLQALPKTLQPVEAFGSGYSPVANETPNPAQTPPVMENKAAEYLGLGQVEVT